MRFSPPRSLPWLFKQRSAWFKRTKTLVRNKRLYLRLLPFVIFVIVFMRPRRAHPTTIPAPPDQLLIPSSGEDVLAYAHRHGAEHGLPVYMFYKARSGQLNNQLVSLFNALAIAKQANATLVAPFAFYGSESYLDFESGRNILFHLQKWFDLHVHQNVLRAFGLYYKHDEILGDYFDASLINQVQPVVSIAEFQRGKGGSYLRTFSHVLTRRGDAPFYHMTLGKRSIFEKNVNIRGEYMFGGRTVSLPNPASRKDLDCNFNVSAHFRGLQYNAGVNGNYLFLSRLYRSHSLNCTSAYPYWLHLRRHVQPRVEIREYVARALHKWGKLMTVHLRLFPFDLDKFSTEGFCNYFLSRYANELAKVDRIYVAYSVSSGASREIVSELRRRLGYVRVITADEHGKLHDQGPAFNMRYAAPLVDMWTCVHSSFFVGRLGSSLSWNVVYWREAFGQDNTAQNFYKLEDFSTGRQKNPTDSYGF